MDQYPFEINLTVIGSDAFDLIELLIANGFEAQAESAQKQVDEQMK
jgi:hypothetical protein